MFACRDCEKGSNYNISNCSFLKKTPCISSNDICICQNFLMFLNFFNMILIIYPFYSRASSEYISRILGSNQRLTNKSISFTKYWILHMYCQKKCSPCTMGGVPFGIWRTVHAIHSCIGLSNYILQISLHWIMFTSCTENEIYFFKQFSFLWI